MSGGSARCQLSLKQALLIPGEEHACQRAETWARRLYRMDLQQKRIDMINTVREEMRDQVRLMISSMESDVVVATLLLSIGFGLSCEGTFPNSEAGGAGYSGSQQWALEAYAALLALSLVFPLGSLVLTLATRAVAEHFFKNVSGDLREHIQTAMGKITSQIPLDTEGKIEEVNSFLADARLVAELAQGLTQKVRDFHTWFPIARMLICCGLLSLAMTCSVMLGIIFSSRFPDSPWVWRCYSGTVAAGACGCIIFAASMHGRLRRPAPPPRPSPRARAAGGVSSKATGRGRSSVGSADAGLREPLLGGCAAAAATAAGQAEGARRGEA